MKPLIIALLVCCAFPAHAQDAPLAIVVGDSLGRDYPQDNAVGIQGWGYEIRKYFKTELQWRNDAWGGESTSSFLTNGRWANTLAAHPKWILVMLGTNDCCEAGTYADPNTTYRANLHRMVVDARAINAEILFVTSPPVRVGYDPMHVMEPGYVAPWADAMVAQAQADNVPVVRLYPWLLETYKDLGLPQSQAEYGCNDPNGLPDPVHFSPYGADRTAQQIVSQLPQLSKGLASHLAAPTISVFPYE